MDPTFWDQRYADDEHVYGTEPNDFLRAEAGRIPVGPVLCLAEGEGRNAAFLAGLGHTVTAVDQSAVGLAKAARLAAARGLTIAAICADLADYAPPVDTFTGVVAIFAHVPPPVRRVMYARAIAALRPGGVLIIEVYAPEQLAFATGGPKDPALLPSLAALSAELAGLDLVIARAVERDVVEGRFHSGRAATIQIVGVRT
jgi:SAM-dependent methyltransferase